MNFNFVALRNLNLAKSNQIQQTLAVNPVSNWMDLSHVGGPSTCTANAVGGLNPAVIWDPAGRGWDLEIDVARWFFRSYNVGYQVGLFCHEIYAHYKTDDDIWQPGGLHRGNTAVVPHALANSEEGIIAAGGNITDTITAQVNNPGAADQPDHIFASSNAYGRFLAYRDSMHRFGVDMAAAGGGGGLCRCRLPIPRRLLAHGCGINRGDSRQKISRGRPPGKRCCSCL